MQNCTQVKGGKRRARRRELCAHEHSETKRRAAKADLQIPSTISMCEDNLRRHVHTRGRTPPSLTEKWDISAADPCRGDTIALVLL